MAPSKRPLIFKKIREIKKDDTKLLQVAAFGTEGTRSAILTACRGYRSEEYPDGIDVDTAQYMTGLIPAERGFLWSIKDVVYGNEEKDRKPINAFINEVNKYPRLLEIIEQIEGLVNKRTLHASGVILYNVEPWHTNAVMKSPSGDLSTQFELHNSEFLGDLKFDFLVTEVTDKICEAIELLQEYNKINRNLTLRQVYQKYLYPDVLDLNNKTIWNKLEKNEVLDCFQFNTPVGAQAARLIKPQSPAEMTAANGLMRLMGEKGQDTPLEKYVKFKFNPELWRKEFDSYGLNDKEWAIIQPYYKEDYGLPPYQESVMEILMDKNISNFTLTEANGARKIIAKKQMDKIPILREDFFNRCQNKNFGRYIWDSAIKPQLG